MNTADDIRDILLLELQWPGDRDDLTDDLELIDANVLDSLDMLTLVSLVEERFNVRVRDEDVVPSNFGTIRRIADFIHARRESPRHAD